MNKTKLRRNTVIILCIVFSMFLGCGKSKDLNLNVSKNNYTSELIGIWCKQESMGAGMEDTYYFYKDSSFRFSYSEYDEEKRLLDFSGSWSVEKRRLLLEVTKKTEIQGGHFEKASPSASSKRQIVNGEKVFTAMNPPEKKSLALGKIVTDESAPYPLSLTIGGIKYWKYADDPYALE